MILEDNNSKQQRLADEHQADESAARFDAENKVTKAAQDILAWEDEADVNLAMSYPEVFNRDTLQAMALLWMELPLIRKALVEMDDAGCAHALDHISDLALNGLPR